MAIKILIILASSVVLYLLYGTILGLISYFIGIYSKEEAIRLPLCWPCVLYQLYK